MIAQWRNSSVCFTASGLIINYNNHICNSTEISYLLWPFCNYYAPSKPNRRNDDSFLLFQMCYVVQKRNSISPCKRNCLFLFAKTCVLFCHLIRKSRYTRANIVPLEITIVKRVLGKINRGSGFLYQTVKTCHTRPTAYSRNSLHTFSSGEKKTFNLLWEVWHLNMKQCFHKMISYPTLPLCLPTLCQNGKQYVVFEIVLSSKI